MEEHMSQQEIWNISHLNWNVPLDDERNLTVEQFCWAEGLTESQFNYLVKAGRGPLIYDLVFGLGPRITANARRAWHAGMAFEMVRAHADDEDVQNDTSKA